MDIEVNETGPPVLSVADFNDLFSFARYWSEPSYKADELICLLQGGCLDLSVSSSEGP